MASPFPNVDFVALARTERRIFERALRMRIARTFRAARAGIVDGIQLLRTAPPLGDVGTRGNDLTRWVQSWNLHGNTSDCSRE